MVLKRQATGGFTRKGFAMVDPVTLATTALAVLSPHIETLKPLLAKILEGSAGEIGKTAVSKAEALFESLAARWRGQPTLKKGLERYVEDPVTLHERMRSLLETEFEGDEVFRRQVAELLAGQLAPELFIHQTITHADEAIGAEIGTATEGRIEVHQEGYDVGKAVAAKIDQFGKSS